jgi:hypothetical protein
MSIRETHSACSKVVNVGGGNFAALGVVALDIAVAKVVGEDDDDVGLLCGSGLGQGGGEQESGEEEFFHRKGGREEAMKGLPLERRFSVFRTTASVPLHFSGTWG